MRKPHVLTIGAVIILFIAAAFLLLRPLSPEQAGELVTEPVDKPIVLTPEEEALVIQSLTPTSEGKQISEEAETDALQNLSAPTAQASDPDQGTLDSLEVQ
ncbi:hypothetical protein A2704_06240 [Candidatus Kaiserbacteria bacterium RIFCSPHIGHO2_01_FULL_54_36b]|uniref:Uncharacterized protein n=1 Tax=Candidatus Kaiserbacteria bacterium RIFCSPHIGHO2_01_FULL_54_36b TaxID=1798483 RepID=A0A1F6CL58_9BACT|nr:MAG: hypothetical protein A2704_06240 [Candidatus Kaiserbacteria bacterium RIFCSPHIGHO2_01_FULL_54_36b]